MRYAILGTTSFTGRAFAEAVESGNTVQHFNRPVYDLADVRKVDMLISDLVKFQPDCIVNFMAASMVAQSWARPSYWAEVNVVGMTQLCDGIIRSGMKLFKFLQVSTPEVYGSMGVPLSEGAPFNPTTPYAVTRAACDMMLRCFHRQHGFPVVFSRSVNVYGPRQPFYRLIPKVAYCALTSKQFPLEGDGKSKRSFIYIDDLAKALSTIIINGKAGEDYHISGSPLEEIRHVVDMVCDAVGVPFARVAFAAPERDGKDMCYYLNDQKFRKLHCYPFPSTPLWDGIEATVAWVKRQDLSNVVTEWRR